MAQTDLQRVLCRWGLQDASTRPITSGHINRTLLVTAADGARFVLQRLNPIFGPEVNEDIEAITARLQVAGLQTPRLVRCVDEALWIEDSDGACWRLMTFIEGQVLERVDSPERCRRAAVLLGRFHRALWDCDHAFVHQRPGVHDTGRHLAALEAALSAHADHRLFAQVEPLGRAILQAASALDLTSTQPLRVVHGDPKITNIIFAPDGKARCLVDLDTLARMPLALELGDALRSWCSPQGEEQEGPLELELFRAAMTGYASAIGPLPDAAERQALGPAVELIALELAARFGADALNERYFGWDRQRFAAAGEHNLQRARAQLSLARSARELKSELRRQVELAWSSSIE